MKNYADYNEPKVELRPKSFHFEITWGKLIVAACVGVIWFASHFLDGFWSYSDSHNGTLFAYKAQTDKEFSILWDRVAKLEATVNRDNQRLDDISKATKP